MNVSKRNVALLVAPLLGLVLVFQNCSEVDFEKVNGELVQKSDFSSNESEQGLEPEPIEIAEPAKEVEPVKEVDDIDKSPTEVAEEDKKGRGKDIVRGDDRGREDEMKEPKIRDTASEESKGSGKTLCGLVGPGSSNVIGFVKDLESLHSQHATSSAVCMSVEACLDIASQAFDVKGPVRGRGICKEGKTNVVYLSDEQVQALVDKIE